MNILNCVLYANIIIIFHPKRSYTINNTAEWKQWFLFFMRIFWSSFHFYQMNSQFIVRILYFSNLLVSICDVFFFFGANEMRMLSYQWNFMNRSSFGVTRAQRVRHCKPIYATVVENPVRSLLQSMLFTNPRFNLLNAIQKIIYCIIFSEILYYLHVDYKGLSGVDFSFCTHTSESFHNAIASAFSFLFLFSVFISKSLAFVDGMIARNNNIHIIYSGNQLLKRKQ